MFEWLLVLAKPIDAPGSMQFLVLCLVVALVLRFVWPKNRRLTRGWLAAVVAVYLFLALPVVAKTIAGGLPETDADAAVPHQLDALLIFDGDNRRGRARSSGQIYAASRPREVWVLGGEWIFDVLPEAGVPLATVKQDDKTLNTRDQIDWVARYEAQAPLARTAIVASRLQMPRVERLARAAGLRAALVSSPVDDEPPTTGLSAWVPMYIALRVSRDALYEHAALSYYRRNGWIAP